MYDDIDKSPYLAEEEREFYDGKYVYKQDDKAFQDEENIEQDELFCFKCPVDQVDK